MTQTHGQEEPLILKVKKPLNALQNIPFHCEGVIDMRNDSILGQEIRKKKKRNILLAGNFERTMKKYFSYLIPKTESTTPIYFIFRDLHIPEYKKNKQQSRLYMQIEFAIMRNDSLFSLGILDQHAANYTAVQASTYYSRIIVTLNHLIRRARYFKFSQKPLTNLVAPPSDHTLNKGDVPPRGLYSSLAMLRYHRPMDGIDFSLKANKNKIPRGNYFSLKTTYKENPHYISFISTGDSLYLNTEKRAGNRILKFNNIGKYIYFNIQNIDASFLTGLGDLGIVVVFGREFYRNNSFILDTETNHFFALNATRLYQVSFHIDPSIIKDFLKTDRTDADLKYSIGRLNEYYANTAH